MTIVGSSIQENAEQNLYALSLGSTEGNVEINNNLTTEDKTILVSEKKVAINASIKANEIDAYGKKGVTAQTPLPDNPTTKHELLKKDADGKIQSPYHPLIKPVEQDRSFKNFIHHQVHETPLRR